MTEWTPRISDNLGKLHELEIGPKFSSIYQCQKYIDDNLQDLEQKLKIAYSSILKQSDSITGKWTITTGGSFIRCYNIKQKRWADGFDF